MFRNRYTKGLIGLIFGLAVIVAPAMSARAADTAVSSVITTKAAVTGNALKIREHASGDAAVIAIASHGAQFTVTGTSGDEWIVISYQGGEAYVSSKYVTLHTVQNVIMDENESESTDNEDSSIAAETKTAEESSDAEVSSADTSASKEASVTPAASAPETNQVQAVSENDPAVSGNDPVSSVSGNNAAAAVSGNDITAVTTPEIAVEANGTESTAAAVAATTAADTAPVQNADPAAGTDASAATADVSAETDASAETEAADAAQTAAVDQTAVSADPSAAQAAYTNEELTLLAALIQCEAVGEPYDGKVAVGQVVLNRVASAEYPNSITEVIYQAGQFTPVRSGKVDALVASGSIDAECMQAAQAALGGTDIIGSATRFNRVHSDKGQIIGNHSFWG